VHAEAVNGTIRFERGGRGRGPGGAALPIGKEKYPAGVQERVAASAKDPALADLLTAMQQARVRLKSGVETVQSISMNAGLD
jgi:hypothetical protein